MIIDRTSRQRKARICRATVALLFFAGSLSTSLHFALVRHVLCGEHGETIHASGRSAVAERARAWQPLHALTRASPVRLCDEHDPCTLLAASRERALAGRAVTISFRGRRCPGPSLPLPGGSGSPIPLRWLAPKHSPPA